MSGTAALIRTAFSNSRIAGHLPEPIRAYALSRCLEATPHLETIPDVFGEYTDHGVEHSCAVLALGDKLLGPICLNEWECLIFTLAAFHHDIGMSCPRQSWGRLELESSFIREHRYLEAAVLPSSRLLDERPEALRAQIRLEYLRRHHGKRCEQWISKTYPAERPASLTGDVYVWDVVSAVCVGHTLGVEELRGGVYTRSRPVTTLQSVDVTFLTCLLRLADICHLGRDRALPHVREAMKFNSRLSREIWEALGDVSGVDCDAERGIITIAARPRSFERHRLISSCVTEIRQELQNTHDLLSERRPQLPWRWVDATGIQPHSSATYIFEPDARFQLVHDRIVRLLMGSRLYADRLYALRECLQNAIDSVRLFKSKDRSAVGRIVIHYGISPGGGATLDIFDNGVGMDREICLKHLMSVGSRPFASSERGYRDWAAEGVHLIAQHGIGFLSCFMLADRVEVFSKYPEAAAVHLILDSPTLLGEFRATDENEFPRWDGALLSETLPWDERHGTCVRLYLNAAISKYVLMLFLTTNVLRTGERISVVYQDDTVALSETWGPTDEWRARALDEPDEATLGALREQFLARQSHQSLDGPPRDPSVEEAIEVNGDIRGIVRLRLQGDPASRLSQEGFFIREGAESLLGDTPDGHRFPFYFDLDVRGRRCFELDAERARIIDGQIPRVGELVEWIEERGLRALASMESSLFFPCGGQYYHGGSDLLIDNDLLTVEFHEALCAWYSPERMGRVVAEGRFEKFTMAKMYAILGKTRCSPISIAEMLGKEFGILVSGNTETADPRARSTRRRREGARAVLDQISRMVDLESVVILPGFPESFWLPLSIVFDCEWIDAPKGVLLGRLRERCAWEVPLQDVIGERFQEARRSSRRARSGA